MIIEEHKILFKKANNLHTKGFQLLEKSAELLTPIFDELIKKKDAALIQEYLNEFPSSFHRAELRAYIKQLIKGN